jgi:hypothetical protein
MSVTIDQEGIYIALLVEEEEQRKRVVSGPLKDSIGGAPLKYRLVYTLQVGKSQVPPPPPQWNHHPPQ